jgi:Cof subfamily protein (haloacid dehalogenase superfamily)
MLLQPLIALSYNFLDTTIARSKSVHYQFPSRPRLYSPPASLSTALFSAFEHDDEDQVSNGRKSDKTITKGDLYGHEELLQLLNIHNIFSDDMAENEPTANDDIPNRHGYSPNTASPSAISFDMDTQSKINRIKAIASDVDGTLLSSKQTLHPRTKLAMKRAIELASKKDNLQYFFLATGKSRKGALNSLGLDMEELINKNKAPGVYLQGLYCVDEDGTVVFEKKLSFDAVAAVETLVNDHGISIVAYDGDSLYTTKQTDIVRHLHDHYGEPMPVEISNEAGTKLVDHSAGFHKVLLMDHDTTRLREIVRPELEKLAWEHNACVTQALPTMLELLPDGCSKALGVSKVCEALELDMSSELLALGDAENDVEMLRRAAIGIAMGNACPKAKAAADFVMTETNDEGGAGAAMELFGFKQYL